MLSFPKGQFKVVVECRFPLANPGATLTGKDGSPFMMNLVPGVQFITFAAFLPLYVDHKSDKYTLEVFDGGESYGTTKISLGKVFKKGPMLLALDPSEAKVQIGVDILPLPQLYASFDVKCKDLDKMDRFGKSDPYVEIYRKNHLDTWVRIFKSKYKKKTLNPKWDDITIPYDYFCSKTEHLFQDPSQNDTELLIKVWDYDTVSPDDVIGEVTVKFNQLFGTEYPLLRDKKYKKKKKNSGTITFKDFKIKQTKGYVDYFIKDKKRITCSFFIDFGGSSNRKKYEDDWVEALDAIAKSFRHNVASKGHINARIFNHKGSRPALDYQLGPRPELGRKEIVEQFRAKNHISGLSRYYSETKDGKVVEYAAEFGPVIRRGAALSNGQDYHVSVYFTDNLFGGVDKGRDVLYHVNENPIPWSAVFVYPPHEGIGKDFRKVGVNSYVKEQLSRNFSARRNVTTKLGRDYAPDYSDMASDIYNEIILQAITYYEMRE